MSGKPVARVGDETAHGGKIVEGDPHVLVGGKPVARVGDDHSCPRSGHRGGPVLPPCTPQVLVGGKPVARVGDKLQCPGDDTIISGDNTVLIGGGAMPLPAPQPLAEQDYVDLHYTYADGEGVPRAKYVVLKGGVEVAKGSLDEQGKARALLPAKTDKVTYYFDDDPGKYMVYAEHRPRPSPYLMLSSARHPIENERATWESITSLGWGKTTAAVEAAGEALESSGEWCWGVLKGDFNEDASMGQLTVRGVISFVPILGSALDVQDLTAAVYFLIWKKRFNEALIWFMLVVTLLGCIPLVGDAGKMAIKMLKKAGKGDTLAKLLSRLNAMGKGNAFKWLLDLKDKLPSYGKEVASTFKKILGDLTARLTKIRGYSVLESIKGEIDAVLATIQKVRAMVDEMFTKVVNELKSLLDDALGKSKRVVGEGPTRTELHLTQNADLKALGRGMKLSTKNVDDLINAKYGKYLPDNHAADLVQKNTVMLNRDEFVEAVSKHHPPKGVDIDDIEGFYDPKTGKNVIRADNPSADGALLHESFHQSTSRTFSQLVPTGFNEGVTEYLTKANVLELGLNKSTSYPLVTEQVRSVVRTVGEDKLLKGYFSGDVNGLAKAYDQANHLGNDPKTWNKLRDRFSELYAMDLP